MKPQLLIEKYPFLSEVFASSHPTINAITIVLSSLLLMSVGWFDLQVEHIYLYGLGFVFSWFYWTFFEYAFHRWFYHGKFKSQRIKQVIHSFHVFHHLNIEDKRVITAGPVMILVLGLFLILPLYFILNSLLDVFSVVSVCILWQYYFYEWVHYLIHQEGDKKNYIKFISNHHNHHHHKNWSKNFGNTTSLWDHLLGTYEKSCAQ